MPVPESVKVSAPVNDCVLLANHAVDPPYSKSAESRPDEELCNGPVLMTGGS